MNSEQFKRYTLIAGIGYAVVLLLAISLLIGSALSEKYNLVYHWNELRVIKNVTLLHNNVDKGSVSLPFTVKDLHPGDRVTLVTSVQTEVHDNLLVKTEGAPMRLYVDSVLYDSDGDPGTFPSFQKTPSPNLLSIALPAESGGKEIRFDYTIPESVESLELPAVYLGDNQMLFMHLVSANGIPFAIGLLLILGGIIIMSITLMVVQRVPEVNMLLWLGLACLNAGFWGFCSNDLAIYLIPAPNLLYVGASVGLLFCAVSFLRYGVETLKPHHRMPVVVTYTVMRAVFLLAILIHLMGLYSFSYSLDFLQLVSLVTIVAFGFFVLYEFIVYRNPQARSLGIPCIILTACALVSIVNRFVIFMRPESLLFQVGIVIFVGWTVVVGWFFIRAALDEAERSAQLELEVVAMNRSLDMQRTLYNRLSRSTEEVRALRHDLRHQLQAIRGYLQKDNVTGALGYVDAISGTIPEIADKLLCDNFAVNAVAVHYLDKAMEAHIQTDLRLVVPEDLGQIHDNDMSIIVGNLFENAIEACLFVDEDKRFIRMSSKVVKKRLTLVIDNSFDGTYTEKGGEFYSRKRQGKGVGISSVRAVVERYGGSLKYEVANGVFMTSLYVKM
ncbi:MAG: GHKL domain-containing protein [Coriobacteriales bacterium]|jgi:hypothetical protein|nr:GHKL domain-containing protein [Coriobacteriales bacterium]